MVSLMAMLVPGQLSLLLIIYTRTLFSSFQKVDGETTNKDREIKKCMTEAYKKTDDEFLQEASKASPVWKDGSTAVTALVMDDVLYVANLGDSKALLCRCSDDGKISVVSLSKDHSPSQYEERMRIQKAGGNVREGRVLGVLEVSRSIGDGRFKRCGVSCVPDVMRCTITDNDRVRRLKKVFKKLKMGRKMSKLTQWLRGSRKRVTKSLVKLSEMGVRIT